MNRSSHQQSFVRRVTPSLLALLFLLGAQSSATPTFGADAVKDLQGTLKQATNEQLRALGQHAFAKVSLSRQEATAAQRWLANAYADQIKRERAAELKGKVVKVGKHEMKYDYRVFGKAPKTGRSLFISMHGGGGAPKAVNDQQWRNQIRLYQPQEGIYLCPRAPTDTWNLWHQGHIDALFDRLIETFVACENVDPNRVYVMGYSAGGDGVYQIAPRMADRWAAAAMMAGHPNDASPLGLRNIGFTLHMGGNDGAYNRNKVAAQWKEKLAELQAGDKAGYEHLVKIHQGKGHWMNRQDAVAVPWMAKFTRNPIPKKIVWHQDDVRHSRFYWLHVDLADEVKRGSKIVARIDGQTIAIEESNVANFTIRLNDDMLDLDKPVTIRHDGKVVFSGQVKRTIETIAATLAERGDPKGVFSAEASVRVAQ